MSEGRAEEVDQREGRRECGPAAECGARARHDSRAPSPAKPDELAEAPPTRPPNILEIKIYPCAGQVKPQGRRLGSWTRSQQRHQSVKSKLLGRKVERKCGSRRRPSFSACTCRGNLLVIRMSALCDANDSKMRPRSLFANQVLKASIDSHLVSRAHTRFALLVSRQGTRAGTVSFLALIPSHPMRRLYINERSRVDFPSRSNSMAIPYVQWRFHTTGERRLST